MGKLRHIPVDQVHRHAGELRILMRGPDCLPIDIDAVKGFGPQRLLPFNQQRGIAAERIQHGRIVDQIIPHKLDDLRCPYRRHRCRQRILPVIEAVIRHRMQNQEREIPSLLRFNQADLAFIAGS